VLDTSLALQWFWKTKPGGNMASAS